MINIFLIISHHYGDLSRECHEKRQNVILPLYAIKYWIHLRVAKCINLIVEKQMTLPCNQCFITQLHNSL